METGLKQPSADFPALRIYSMNGNEIGKMSATPEAVEILLGERILSIPRKEIKAAGSNRVGRIGLDSYVMKLFISTFAAAKLRSEFSQVNILNQNGVPYPPASIGTVTGEYAEFFISSNDVFGTNGTGPAPARKFMDEINGTSPERLRLPD